MFLSCLCFLIDLLKLHSRLSRCLNCPKSFHGHWCLLTLVFFVLSLFFYHFVTFLHFEGVALVIDTGNVTVWSGWSSGQQSNAEAATAFLFLVRIWKINPTQHQNLKDIDYCILIRIAMNCTKPFFFSIYLVCTKLVGCNYWTSVVQNAKHL